MNLQREIMLIDQARYLAAFLGQQFAPSEKYRCAISPVVKAEVEVDGEATLVEVAESAITANFEVSLQDAQSFQEIADKLHAYMMTGKSVIALVDAELAKAAEEAQP